MKKKYSLLVICLLFITATAQSQSVSELYNEAMNAYNASDFTKSYDIFEKFFTNYNQYDELYASAKFYSSESLLNLGKQEAAANSYEFLIKNFKNSYFREKTLFKLGSIYFEEKEYERSRERFSRLREEFPYTEFTGASLYWTGEAYLAEDKYDEAIAYFLKSIDSKRNNKFVDHAIFSAAYAYEKQGKYTDAVTYYDKLLSFYPDSPLASSAQIRIGICYFKLKDYDSSILELSNPLVHQLPDNQVASALYLTANSYFKVKEFDNAEKTYLEILKKFPKSGVFQDVRYALGWTYFQQKKYDDAYKIFNSLSNGSDTIASKAFYWKGEAKRYLGDEAEALKIYEAFLKKYPVDPARFKVHFLIGTILYNQQKYDQAEKYLKPIFNSSDDQLKSKALVLNGEIKLNKKEYNSASELFEDALKIEKIDAEKKNRALFGLAISNYYMKDFTEALKYFSLLQEKAPDFEQDKINFYSGEIKFEKEKYSEALGFYSRVDVGNPDVGLQSLYSKGYCCYNLKDYENAVNFFTEYVKRSSGEKQLDARLRLADCYFVNKGYAAAGKIYQEIFKNHKAIPNADYAYFQYAQSLFKAEKYSEAINEFTALKNKYPRSQFADQSLYFIGWIHFQQGKYEEAIGSYRNVMAVYPKTNLAPLLEYSIGDSYYNMGQYDAAIESYSKVLNNYPSSNYVVDAVNGIQYSYVAKGEPEKAASEISGYVQRNAGKNFTDQLYFKKSEIFFNQRQYDKARNSYREFLSLYPNSRLAPDAYYWIGKCSQGLNQQSEALRNFDIVVKSYPSSELAANAAIEAAAIYNYQKKYDYAISLYNKVLESSGSSSGKAEVLFQRGLSYSYKGDYQSALNSYDEVIQHHAGTIFADKAKLEVGVISYDQKNYENAMACFRNLSENRSDDLGAKAQFFLGVSLLETKKYTDAIAALVRVSTIFPSFDEWVARSYLKLGECYEKLKDYPKAKDMYKIVINSHRGDTFAKEAQIKLRNVK